MPRASTHRWLSGLVCLLAVAAQCNSSPAQVPDSYGQYYQQQFHSAGRAGVGGPNRYLYDKYFYHSPGVSPYMNVFRPDPIGSTSYHAYVQPEVQRRQAATMPANPSPQRRPTSTPSAYYNHWYGAWAK
jgi:hypothetical protein